jgi:glycosyltransferase involved in cell wall biosynthesis
MLYNAAELFAFPSLCEGMGLPPLEAMACGTPVVTSRGSALEELYAGTAWLVDPRSPRALADAMERLLSDEQLASELSRRGLERARALGWETTARRLAEVVEAVA